MVAPLLRLPRAPFRVALGALAIAGMVWWFEHLFIGEENRKPFGPPEEGLVMVWRWHDDCIDHRLEWHGRAVDDFHMACGVDQSSDPLINDFERYSTFERSADVLAVRIGHVLYRLDEHPTICSDYTKLTTDRTPCVREPQFSELMSSYCQVRFWTYAGGRTIREECARQLGREAE